MNAATSSHPITAPRRVENLFLDSAYDSAVQLHQVGLN